MSPEELDHIEQELRLTLPDDYRSFMLEYPFAEHSRPSDELYGSAMYVVRQNREARDEVADSEFWKETYLVSGVVGLDTYYVIDCAKSPTPVLQVNVRTGEVVEDHHDFLQWVQRRVDSYVNFDPVTAEQKYAELRTEIEQAGLFVTPVNPMLDHERISVCSKKLPSGGYSGNSFWVSRINEEWIVGAWGGFVYYLSEKQRIAEFCISWLKRKPDKTEFNFDQEQIEKYGLQLLDDEEFDRLFPG